MKTKKIPAFAFAFFSLAALFFLVACPTTDEPGRVLNMHIDKDNDSLMTFDSLIVKVYSKDSSYTQVVFHGKLTDPKQVMGMQLDPRMSQEYTVSIIGYKGGKVGVNKVITILGANNFKSKDLPTQKGNDTIVIEPAIPEILAPSDTSVAEGDSLRFRVSVRNPLTGATTLTLKDTLPGAALDTVGRDPGDGYFTWRPNYNQGRIEPYAVTFVYASAGRRVEKIARVKVLNVNRPPKITALADQKVKENETLTFKVEAADPDQDSITLASSALPVGATFTSGSFSWKTLVGQAGNYSVKFKAFDGKDSDLVAVLITVGNVDVPPALNVKITSPAQDTLINFTPITVLYTVNGTLLQKKFPLKEGKNRIRIDTTVQSRTAFDTIQITLDTVPPGKPTVNGASPVRTRTPSWTWRSGGNGVGIYRYGVDNEDMASATTLTDTAYIAPKDLDPGTHTLFVQERDAVGNWSQAGRFSVRIDTTRPPPPTVAAEVSPTRNVLPTWTWQGEGEDANDIYRYKLDNSDLRTGTVETKATNYTPENANALKEGSHTLFVQQQDSAGNWSNSGSAVVIIDLTPPGKPKATLAQTSPTNNPRPTWNLSSGQGGMGFYRAKIDDSTLTQGGKSGAFTSFTPDSALSQGMHTLFVQEKDSAGNWSAIQSLAVAVDLTPPAVPEFDATPPTPLNSVKPTWTWKSGGGGTGTYRVRKNDTNWTSGADTITVGSFTPKDSLSEGLHTLYVQERDSASNWSPVAKRTLVLALRGTVGKPGFSAAEASRISIKVSSAGVPYIAFRDSANGEKATVMRWNGNAWVSVGNAGFSAGRAERVSLSLNESGVPYVAFPDGANADKGTVMRFNGSAWETIGGLGFSAGRADDISLALSNTGIPHVAFRDSSNKVTVMRWSGVFWESVGSAGFSPEYIEKISLAISSTGVPYVSFVEFVYGSKISVMRWNGTAWVNVGNSGLSQGSAHYSSLSVSGTGVPYVSFCDGANREGATVMRWSGTTWENLGGYGFTQGPAYFTSLAFSSAGIPFIAFQDMAQGQKLTVMRWSGTSWENVGGAGLSDGRADEISMAISPTGVPYIGFQDGAHGNKATVIKTSFDP